MRACCHLGRCPDLQFAVPDELDDEAVRGAQGRALGHGEHGPELPAGVPDA